jgi:hypothetical protein
MSSRVGDKAPYIEAHDIGTPAFSGVSKSLHGYHILITEGDRRPKGTMIAERKNP